LNAYTPRDQAAVRAAATTFRSNPGVDVATVITELKVGEALVSLLQPDGAPSPVQRTLIKPPSSRVGPVTPAERGILIQTDPIGTRYDTLVDRQSAEEILQAKSAEATAAAAEAAATTEAERTAAAQAKEDARLAKQAARAKVAADRQAAADARTTANTPWNRAIRGATSSATRAAGTVIAREATKAIFGKSGGVAGSVIGGMVRGVLGGLFKGR